MEEKKEAKKQVTVSLNLSVLLFLVVVIGVLLTILGAANDSEGTVYAGLIITPLALFAGGFLLKEENGTVRLGMLIAAGLILGLAVPSAFGLAII